MKKTVLFPIALTAILTAFLASCGGGGNEGNILADTESDTLEVRDKVSDELVNGILSSIPSPVEMSSLIREVESHYNNGYLNDPGLTETYNNNFKKALNIGIYGTDLGYINLYEEKQDALIYLKAMKDLADDLKIGHFFDVSTIKRLASNSQNLDSMLYITTSNYDKMNQYLQEQKRGHLSMLMLVGGWLEALHIASEVSKMNHNEQLVDRVGEQKVVLDEMMILLGFYEHDAQIQELKGSLNKLKEIYDQVKITVEYGEPTIEEVNGVLMVTENNTSKIDITYEEVLEITKIVSDIRKEITE